MQSTYNELGLIIDGSDVPLVKTTASPAARHDAGNYYKKSLYFQTSL